MPGSPPSAAGRAVVATRIDGRYIAFDLDAIDVTEGLSLAMTEADGLSIAAATKAVRRIAATGPVLGFGASAAMARDDLDLPPTIDAIARLAEAALGDRAAG